MAALKKPKKRTLPPIQRKPIGSSQTTKDLLARLEERNAQMKKKNKKKKKKK